MRSSICSIIKCAQVRAVRARWSLRDVVTEPEHIARFDPVLLTLMQQTTRRATHESVADEMRLPPSHDVTLFCTLDEIERYFYQQQIEIVEKECVCYLCVFSR
jgi:hypothetical protein